jgi:hypothetical protein
VGPVVDAEDNWWNACDGPSGAGPGSGDPVSTNVDFTPFEHGACDTDGDLLTDDSEDLVHLTDYLNPDTDGDGCADGEEVLFPVALGGDRDALSPWDFFDVPAPAGPATGADGRPNLTLASVRNKAVGLQDVGVVLSQVGRISSNPAYTQDNNADGIQDGQQMDRTLSSTPGKPWRSGAPNGSISLQDVAIALHQVGYNCSGAP